MAHPWIFEANFEAGTNAEWDSEADTGSLLDFPHFSTLARLNGQGAAAPFTGAYCMRVVAGDTNIHAVTEGDIDIAATGTAWVSFELYISPDFTATADDIFNIFEYQSAGDVVERAIGLRITAVGDGVEIGVGKLAPTAFHGSILDKGRWHHIEMATTLAAGTGTSDLYIDGVLSAGAVITTLTDLAVVEGQFGTSNTLSTTTGTLLFDAFKFDDLQVYPPKQRFPKVVRFTKTQHIFVGPGWIDSAFIRSTGGTLVLHDSDNANALNADSVVSLDTDTPGMEDGAYFERGCYAVLSASTIGEVVIHTGGDSYKGMFGPKHHWSSGAIRHYGSVRKVPKYNN